MQRNMRAWYGRAVGLLVACAFVVGCASQGTNSSSSTRPTAKQHRSATSQRVACVGDSITYGAGIKDRAHNSYPAQLHKMLEEAGAYDVQNFGVSGATLLKNGDQPYWKEGAYQKALDFRPDILVIKLGTNDSKPQNWDQHKGEFVGDYKELIESFRKKNRDVHVYVCLPAPAFPGRWGIREDVIAREVIPMVGQVAAETKAKVIDLHTPLLDYSTYLPDTVHPDERGARVIAQTVANAIRTE